jgi:hypothetical protein
MYRHFRWLQAIENESPSKTTFSKGDVEKAMDGLFNSLLEAAAKSLGSVSGASARRPVRAGFFCPDHGDIKRRTPIGSTMGLP